MADIVLPATTSFEREDIAYAKRERYMTFMSKLHEPMHEAKSDYEIFAMMAEKPKVGEAFTEGLGSAGWIERLYEQSRTDASAHGIHLPAFQAFQQLGMVDSQQLKKNATAACRDRVGRNG